ncbi:MAG: hypothetical protein WAW75_08750 [Gallionella sp.]
MTAVALSPQPKLQFNQGNLPLAGGLLYTYLAGTTTKATTYTDSTGATPNANPIVLNANGEADVYLTSGILYKFTLSPSTDTDPPTNAYWTVDNLFGNSVLPLPYADAGGTADVITATYLVNDPTLVDGYTLLLDIGTTNATTTPTFAPTLNGVLQTARTIQKMVGNVNTALVAGDLQGVAMLVYDLGNLVWILQNPAVANAAVLSATNQSGGTVNATGGIRRAGVLLISDTAPTIASGFGTASPSISRTNGSAAFTVNTTSGTTNVGTLTFPAAPNGWSCMAVSEVSGTEQYLITAISTTSVQVNCVNSTTGSAANFATNSKINFIAVPF